MCKNNDSLGEYHSRKVIIENKIISNIAKTFVNLTEINSNTMPAITRISKNRLKQISALKLRKNRDDEGLYLVEGEKIIAELIDSDEKIEVIAALPDWISQHNSKLGNVAEILELNDTELERISTFKTPNQVLAVVKKNNNKFNISNLQNELTIILDSIQDPGNLGTIIRLADWFGIKNIICSENTAELFNPKVIQSTMGAFLRVNVHYSNLENFLTENNKTIQLPVYGAFLKGENIYNVALPKSAFIIMGNESKGISTDIEKFITHKITIPSFSLNKSKSESLNVAIATAIVCSEFKRL